MSGKLKNLQGLRFGKLTVISFSHMVGKHSYWNCLCDCGNDHIARCDCLKSGSVKSCGCMNTIDREKPTSTKKHKLYRVYWGMKQRCYNPKTKHYNRYGGRGITICEEWLNSYDVFYDWAMTNGYQDSLSIDRIDNNGNYEPTNCRWATQAEQAINKTQRKSAEFYKK